MKSCHLCPQVFLNLSELSKHLEGSHCNDIKFESSSQDDFSLLDDLNIDFDGYGTIDLCSSDSEDNNRKDDVGDVEKNETEAENKASDSETRSEPISMVQGLICLDSSIEEVSEALDLQVGASVTNAQENLDRRASNSILREIDNQLNALSTATLEVDSQETPSEPVDRQGEIQLDLLSAALDCHEKSQANLISEVEASEELSTITTSEVDELDKLTCNLFNSSEQTVDTDSLNRVSTERSNQEEFHTDQGATAEEVDESQEELTSDSSVSRRNSTSSSGSTDSAVTKLYEAPVVQKPKSSEAKTSHSCKLLQKIKSSFAPKFKSKEVKQSKGTKKPSIRNKLIKKFNLKPVCSRKTGEAEQTEQAEVEEKQDGDPPKQAETQKKDGDSPKQKKSDRLKLNKLRLKRTKKGSKDVTAESWSAESLPEPSESRPAESAEHPVPTAESHPVVRSESSTVETASSHPGLTSNSQPTAKKLCLGDSTVCTKCKKKCSNITARFHCEASHITGKKSEMGDQISRLCERAKPKGSRGNISSARHVMPAQVRKSRSETESRQSHRENVESRNASSKHKSNSRPGTSPPGIPLASALTTSFDPLFSSQKMLQKTQCTPTKDLHSSGRKRVSLLRSTENLTRMTQGGTSTFTSSDNIPHGCQLTGLNENTAPNGLQLNAANVGSQADLTGPVQSFPQVVRLSGNFVRGPQLQTVNCTPAISVAAPAQNPVFQVTSTAQLSVNLPQIITWSTTVPQMNLTKASQSYGSIPANIQPRRASSDLSTLAVTQSVGLNGTVPAAVPSRTTIADGQAKLLPTSVSMPRSQNGSTVPSSTPNSVAQSNLVRKKDNQASPGPLFCPACKGRTFMSKQTRAYHIKSNHLLLMKLPCFSCVMDFSNKMARMSHIWAVHCKSASIPCLICGFIAKRDRGLGRHLAMHNRHEIHQIVAVTQIYEEMKSERLMSPLVRDFYKDFCQKHPDPNPHSSYQSYWLDFLKDCQTNGIEIDISQSLADIARNVWNNTTEAPVHTNASLATNAAGVTPQTTASVAEVVEKTTMPAAKPIENYLSSPSLLDDLIIDEGPEEDEEFGQLYIDLTGNDEEGGDAAATSVEVKREVLDIKPKVKTEPSECLDSGVAEAKRDVTEMQTPRVIGTATFVKQENAAMLSMPIGFNFTPDAAASTSTDSGIFTSPAVSENRSPTQVHSPRPRQNTQKTPPPFIKIIEERLAARAARSNSTDSNGSPVRTTHVASSRLGKRHASAPVSDLESTPSLLKVARRHLEGTLELEPKTPYALQEARSRLQKTLDSQNRDLPLPSLSQLLADEGSTGFDANPLLTGSPVPRDREGVSTPSKLPKDAAQKATCRASEQNTANLKSAEITQNQYDMITPLPSPSALVIDESGFNVESHSTPSRESNNAAGKSNASEITQNQYDMVTPSPSPSALVIDDMNTANLHSTPAAESGQISNPLPPILSPILTGCQTNSQDHIEETSQTARSGESSSTGEDRQANVGTDRNLALSDVEAMRALYCVNDSQNDAESDIAVTASTPSRKRLASSMSPAKRERGPKRSCQFQDKEMERSRTALPYPGSDNIPEAITSSQGDTGSNGSGNIPRPTYAELERIKRYMLSESSGAPALGTFSQNLSTIAQNRPMTADVPRPKQPQFEYLNVSDPPMHQSARSQNNHLDHLKNQVRHFNYPPNVITPSAFQNGGSIPQNGSVGNHGNQPVQHSKNDGYSPGRRTVMPSAGLDLPSPYQPLNVYQGNYVSPPSMQELPMPYQVPPTPPLSAPPEERCPSAGNEVSLLRQTVQVLQQKVALLEGQNQTPKDQQFPGRQNHMQNVQVPMHNFAMQGQQNLGHNYGMQGSQQNHLMLGLQQIPPHMISNQLQNQPRMLAQNQPPMYWPNQQQRAFQQQGNFHSQQQFGPPQQHYPPNVRQQIQQRILNQGPKQYHSSQQYMQQSGPTQPLQQPLQPIHNQMHNANQGFDPQQAFNDQYASNSAQYMRNLMQNSSDHSYRDHIVSQRPR